MQMYYRSSFTENIVNINLFKVAGKPQENTNSNIISLYRVFPRLAPKECSKKKISATIVSSERKKIRVGWLVGKQ